MTTNLLPGEIRVERMVKAKKPWAAAAAALLLLGLGGYVLGFGLDYRAYNDPVVLKAEKDGKAAVDRNSAAEGQYRKARDEATKQANNVNAVVAGQGEHLNWLTWTKFVTDSMPQPDASNLQGVFKLNPETKRDFWDLKPKKDDTDGKDYDSGEVAYKRFKDRQAEVRVVDPGKMPPTGPMPMTTDTEMPKFVPSLLQVNVESVDSRFCDDLDAFWTYLRRPGLVAENDVHPIKMANKSPAPNKAQKEAGWIIEIRGYTFHYKQRRFLNDVVCESIVRHGMPDFNPQEPDKPLPTDKPVRNRITHVVLLPDPEYGASRQTDDTTTFERINTPFLDSLVKSAMAAEATPAAAPVGAAPAPPRRVERQPPAATPGRRSPVRSPSARHPQDP